MNTTITESVNVRERLLALGCRAPTGIAILSINLEHAASAIDIRLQSESATVKTLEHTIRATGLHDTRGDSVRQQRVYPLSGRLVSPPGDHYG